MSLRSATLLLGSNLNNPEKNLEEARLRIIENIGPILRETSVMKSLPVEYESSSIFYNFAAEIETSLSPIELLKNLKIIEKQMGREKDSREMGGYSDRIIDIDIVLYDGIHFESPTLSIPHDKHLNKREFSMELLRELEAVDRL